MDSKSFVNFEHIVRKSHEHTNRSNQNNIHPLQSRNIHPDIIKLTKQLFDDKHYPLATFEAYKFIEKTVKEISKQQSMSGQALMFKAFDCKNPLIKIKTPNIDTNYQDEQDGYKHLFAGAMSAIRNTRAHESADKIHETREQCLSHLSFASLLLRVLPNT